MLMSGSNALANQRAPAALCDTSTLQLQASLPAVVLARRKLGP